MKKVYHAVGTFSQALLYLFTGLMAVGTIALLVVAIVIALHPPTPVKSPFKTSPEVETRQAIDTEPSAVVEN